MSRKNSAQQGRYNAILIFLTILFILYQKFAYPDTLPYVAEGESIVLYTEPKEIKQYRPGIVDATDRYIYICYGTQDIISAYDWDGNFAFAILFSCDGRGNAITCYNNLLYIKDGDHRVYVYDDDQLVEYYPPGEFDIEGFYFTPYASKASNKTSKALVILDGTKVLDRNGNLIFTVNKSSAGNVVFVVLCIILVVGKTFIKTKKENTSEQFSSSPEDIAK